MPEIERVLYDDENGLDLLIDDKHNVGLGWIHEALSRVDFYSLDGKPMEVQWNPTHHTFYICVGR